MTEQARSRQAYAWGLASAVMLTVLAVPALAFLLVDATRLFLEWRGHHALFLPGHPQRGIFDHVMILDVHLFVFMLRGRFVLLLFSTVIALPLLLLRPTRQLRGKLVSFSYLTVLLAIGLLMVHYHLKLWL